MMQPRVAVVGSGAWGTTLALLIGRSEPVSLLCHSSETAARLTTERRNERRLPGIDLPAAIVPAADPSVLASADLVILAVPSTHLREMTGRVAVHIAPSADVLSVVKGLETGTLLRMSEVIADAAGIDPRRVAGIAAGANPLTFAGLAGIGDVIATCGSALSRNHRLGEELSKGRSWAEIESSLPGVAEGAYTVDAALAFADRLGVEMPIAREVHNALFEGKSVQRCLIDLLSRESKDELADYRQWAARLGLPGS